MLRELLTGGIFLSSILVNATGAPIPAQGVDCDRLLRLHVPFAESVERGLPLDTGLIAEDLKDRLLLSRAAIAVYADKFPKSPWTHELMKFDPSRFDGEHMIYLSEIGPTLWRVDEFSPWQSAVNSGAAWNPQQAHGLVTRLARGESVEGISPVSGERVKNALIGALALAARKALAPSLGPRDFMAELADAVADLQVRRDLHGYLPALRIEFEATDQDRAKQLVVNPTELALPANHPYLLWVSRILLREALVRRKLVEIPGGTVDVLGDHIDDDEIFLLAAHPEAAPYWRQVLKWNFRIRHYALAGGDWWVAPPLIINAEADRCVFRLGRGDWSLGPAEPLTAEMILESDDLCRAGSWLRDQWREFIEALALNSGPEPQLTIEPSPDHIILNFDDISRARALGFFIYLQRKFPEAAR